MEENKKDQKWAALDYKCENRWKRKSPYFSWGEEGAILPEEDKKEGILGRN